MLEIILLRKRVLAILFLLCFASCSKPCHQWELEKIQTYYPCFNSSKACWFTENKFSGIDVQILCTGCETFIYLDIHLFEFPFEEVNPLKTKIIIDDGNQENSFLAERFEGGQRLLLSSDAASLILDLLSACIPFTISVENYSERIDPVNFENVFQQI